MSNLYNYMQELNKRASQGRSSNNGNSNQPNANFPNANGSRSYTSNPNPIPATITNNAPTDGKVHQAEIVEANQRTTPITPSNTIDIKGTDIAKGFITAMLDGIESESGLSGLSELLTPHVHEVINESPIKHLPEPIVQFGGRLLLNLLQRK